MSPDARSRRGPAASPPDHGPVRTGPSSDDSHAIVYFKRHVDDDPAQAEPGRTFLDSCPVSVRAKMRAILVAVASAPPKRFSGGGYWEAMKGSMQGWFEVRADGPGRRHYRLFCRLDLDALERDEALLVVVTGLDKAFKTVFTDRDYAAVRELGDEYFSRNPRSLVR